MFRGVSPWGSRPAVPVRYCIVTTHVRGHQAHQPPGTWVREILHLLDPRRMPSRFRMTGASQHVLRADGVPDEVVSRLGEIVDQTIGTLNLYLMMLEAVFSAGELEPWVTPLVERARLPGEGARRPEESYRDYTHPLVAALEPFSRHGTLYPKIRDAGPGDPFDLEDLDRRDQQTTIILAAREQDLATAETVLSMAITRLQHLLFERMDSREDEVRPVLLLLDETRRIRQFEANKYITFAREAKAGCVVVYQSLDQIGDEKQIAEILENVGTQIYLGSLVGNTARYFINTLPRRYRVSVTEQVAFGADGRSRTVALGKELVDVLTTNELYHLPAGEWPALVLINDQPRRKPILVDMSDPAAAVGQGPARRVDLPAPARPRPVKPRRQPGAPPPHPPPPPAEEPAAADPFDLIVAPSGEGTYPTIAAAEQAAAPGARIGVHPGIYAQGLVFDKRVTIEGVGPRGEIVLELGGARPLRLTADDVEVRGLTIRGSGGTAVEIAAGRPTLDGCDIGVDVEVAVTILGAASDPTLRRCRIRARDGPGIVVERGGRGLIEACDISGSKVGVAVSTGGNPTLRQCKIHDNTMGIWLRDRGEAQVQECDISANTAAGVTSQEQSRPTLRRCQIRDQGQAGLYVDSGASGIVEDCDIAGNGLHGVQILNGGDPRLLRCRIHESRGCGVAISQEGIGTFEECDIFANALNGVQIDLQSRPILRRCKIHDGAADGILLETGGEATLEDCDIYANAGHGVAIQQRGSPISRESPPPTTALRFWSTPSRKHVPWLKRAPSPPGAARGQSSAVRPPRSPDPMPQPWP